MIGGILVPLVALGFVCVLATAMVMLGLDRGFSGGYELELVLLISSITVGLAYVDKNKKIFNFIPKVI
jgi:putative oxidoreductase